MCGTVRSLRITWKGGVSIEHDDLKLIMDPQSNNVHCSHAFVSHAHLDHSRGFRQSGLPLSSSKETAHIVSDYGYRLDSWKPLSSKGLTLGDIEVVPHNSGHVLGSFEFEIGTPEGTALFTGDFNTRFTKTMKPAEPVPCDVLIIEATFGSPSFVFPSEEDVAEDMICWTNETMKRGKIPTFQTDPLGNAQEIIRIFNESTRIPVVTHWRVSGISRIYQSYGHKLDYVDAKTDEAKEIVSSRELIFIAPKGLDFSNRQEFSPALVSGWALWSKDKAFPLSDHADFKNILEFVTFCKPKIVLTYHGGRYNHTLARYIEKDLAIRAYPIGLIPTNLSMRFDDEKLKNCENAILGITKIPGFTYSRRAIMREVQSYGYSRSEINSALKRLIDSGFLRVEESEDDGLFNQRSGRKDRI